MPLTVRFWSTSRFGRAQSADRKTSNGAPFRIWAYSIPDDPLESRIEWPVVLAKSGARLSRVAAKFAATATRSSALRAVDVVRSTTLTMRGRIRCFTARYSADCTRVKRRGPGSEGELASPQRWRKFAWMANFGTGTSVRDRDVPAGPLFAEPFAEERVAKSKGLGARWRPPR